MFKRNRVNITSPQVDPPEHDIPQNVLILDDEDIGELFNNPEKGIEIMARIDRQTFTKIFMPLSIKGSEMVSEFKELLDIWGIKNLSGKIYYYAE